MRTQLHQIRFRDCLATALIAFFALGAAASPTSAPPVSESARGAIDTEAGKRATNAYDKVPLGFERNQGQVDQRVRYLTRGPGYALYLTDREAVFTLQKGGINASTGANALQSAVSGDASVRRPWSVVRVELKGANQNPTLTGIDRLPGKVSYFVGRDSRQWRTNVPTYAAVKLANIYPDIDLVYHGNNLRGLEYDFVLRPGGDAKAIRLAFAGAQRTALNARGDLVIKLNGGELVEHAPVIYQEVNGRRQSIQGGYVLGDEGVGIKLAAYDAHLPVIIDPTLSYSTYLGGTLDDIATGIAADGQGNSYITGYTPSINFPTTAGAAFPNYEGGSEDAFVTKLNPDGSQLVYSTYLGGFDSDDEVRGSIAVDSQGNAYIAGTTTSIHFPVTPNAFQPNYGGGPTDAFVTKLSRDGSELVYSTYLGGRSFELEPRIAVDNQGNAYVTGYTGSTDFPIIPGAFQASFGGIADVFVSKLDTNGTALVYSTYLGGTDIDFVGAIAVDGQGSAYVTGNTNSANFPVTPGAYQTSCKSCQTDRDAFVTKLNASGSQLVYSTFLGGSAFDQGSGIAVDAQGAAYIAGFTQSSDFPSTPGAFQTTYGGLGDAYVTKLNPSGSQLAYSTFLGGNTPDEAKAIAVDRAGNAYVTGDTESVNFPTTADAFQPSYGGGSANAFVSRLNVAGSSLNYSTFLGNGPVNSQHTSTTGNAIAVDCCGNAYVTGITTSTTFPVTANAYQINFGGGEDAFAAKFKFGSPIITAPTPGATVSGPVAIQTQRNTGVKWLNVYVDGTHLASSPPFTFSWDSTKFSGGQHEISAISYGYDNLVSGTDQVTVQVNNPVVKIDQPEQAAKVSGAVSVVTERTQGVSWINVYIDGKHLASTPPFTVSWDSTKVSNGGHTISIKGYAPAGTLLGSASVIVNVAN